MTDRNSPSLYRPMDPILCVLCRRPNPTPESSACPTCVPPDEGEIRTTADRDKYRQALTRISSFAATCRFQNTPEWMAMLVDHLNQVCETLNVSQRFRFEVDGIGCVDGEHEDYRG